jgi:uncharacterized protein YjbI with pentapeptide repeats
MTPGLTAMKGEEFIKKILEGERDFRSIKLEEGFCLSEHTYFKILYNYILKEAGISTQGANHFKEDPLDISNSEFRYLVAKGLYLPYAKGFNADFSYADLSDGRFGRLRHSTNLEGSNFKNSKFYEADLSFSCLRDVNFQDANLKNADIGCTELYHTEFHNANLRNASFYITKFLEGAILTGADVEGASFEKAKFVGADIRHVKNLDKSRGLDSAVFQATKVTQKELDIIKSASERFILYE